MQIPCRQAPSSLKGRRKEGRRSRWVSGVETVTLLLCFVCFVKLKLLVTRRGLAPTNQPHLLWINSFDLFRTSPINLTHTTCMLPVLKREYWETSWIFTNLSAGGSVFVEPVQADPLSSYCSREPLDLLTVTVTIYIILHVTVIVLWENVINFSFRINTHEPHLLINSLLFCTSPINHLHRACKLWDY